MNNSQQTVRYLNYDDFSGNKLSVNSQVSLSTQELSNGLNVEVYIGGELMKQKNVTVENLDGKKIEGNYINLSSISIDITK